MDFIWSQHLNVKLYACRCRWFYMSINRVDGVLVCVFESGWLWSKQHILQSSFKSHIQHSRYNTEPRYFCVWNGVVWCGVWECVWVYCHTHGVGFDALKHFNVKVNLHFGIYIYIPYSRCLKQPALNRTISIHPMLPDALCICLFI